MDVRFHCASKVRKQAKKSKHRVFTECETVTNVLRLHPEYGVEVKGYAPLRKMRVAVPSLKLGKSGGYRMIYCVQQIDEIQYAVFVALYFKGDQAAISATNSMWKRGKPLKRFSPMCWISIGNEHGFR
ncbi:MAG: hypothetical protein HOP19_03270 [Acidobacteria bacterium]|nr:hypothetical protein [Acidobacteriota bacterium]